MKKIYVIGIGPGDYEHTTVAALKAIEESQVIVGYRTYIKLVEDLIEGKEVVSSGMMQEIRRCEETLKIAEQGKTVSLISSGDAGIYGMAGIMSEVVLNANSDVEVEVVPGVTASTAAASTLGAPIMHDYATISLSDLLTDWELIQKRIDLAGQADFVINLYNPRSKGRRHQIEVAREILLRHKSPSTPVGIVRNAKRTGEEKVVTTLQDMLEHEVDMVTMVIIGNSNTYVKEGKMITPRGYKL